MIKKPHAEVGEETNWELECPGHRKVKAAMDHHPSMVHENQTDGCLPCQHGTSRNHQTRWRRKETGPPPPDLAPPLPGMLPPSAVANEGAQSSEIEGVPPRYM